MPLCGSCAQFGLSIFHRLLKGRVGENFFDIFALDTPLQGQQVLRDHIRHRSTIFSSKDLGELGEVLVETYIETSFRHNKSPLYLLPLCAQQEQMSRAKRDLRI